jgi:hypothetical protein
MFFLSLSLYMYIYINYKTVYLYISAHVGVYIRTYQTLRYITFHSIAYHNIHTHTHIYIYISCIYIYISKIYIYHTYIYISYIYIIYTHLDFYHAKTQAISLFIHLTHDTCVLEETCPKNLDWELLKELDTFKHFFSVL